MKNFSVFDFFTDFIYMKQSKKSFVTGLIIPLLLIMLPTLYSSCKTLEKETQKKEPVYISRKLLDNGQLTAEQLADFFINENNEKTWQEIYDFAALYIEEAASENINSDFAFAQMCLETGFLRFGGLVQPEWHNYCGLGAISAEQPGCIFETEQLGVRAHIQHIQAYATKEEVTLNNELVDPRYSWVHKTKYAESIEELAASWAADPNYAAKINNILTRMEEFVNQDL